MHFRILRGHAWGALTFATMALMAISTSASGQELNCSISVNTSGLGGTNDYAFLGDQLKEQLDSYINGKSWTSETYDKEERIRCSFTLSFTGVTSSGIDTYEAQLTVKAERPIYNTSQSVPLFQIHDKNWVFPFDQSSTLYYDEDRFDPVSSVLDFYVYVILGYDYDSFSELGGTEFFERSRKIADIAKSSGGGGWASVGNDRTRGVLIEQLTDPRMIPLRRASYMYHFGALDHFIVDVNSARQSALNALVLLQNLYEEMSNQYVTDLFFENKYEEITSVFEESPQAPSAYGILLRIDPTNQTHYDRLRR